MLTYMLRGRLLASFQHLEHEGGDTRSQGGIKDNDIKIKIQDHRYENGPSKGISKITRLEVSRRRKKDSQLNDHPLGEGHMARQCTQPKRPRNATWYKDKAMLAEAQEVGQILDEEQLTKDLDTYDSDSDDNSNAKAVLMANISNYGSDVISKAQQDSMILSVIGQMSKQMINHVNNWEKANKIKPTLYDGIVISAKHVAMPVIDDKETLILEEESRSKMSEKEKDPEAIKQNISHKPIDYEKLNRLSEDFGKCFTLQQELSAEQAFWLRISNLTNESSNNPPVKVEVSSELPKISLVNVSLKKLKFHLAQFDSVVKKRTTPDARPEGELGFEHTKDVFNDEIISFLKSLKDIFNVFDKDLLNGIIKVHTVFDQMNVVVQQSSVDKQFLEIAKKELLLENDRLLQQIMSQDVLLTMINYMSLIGESVNMERKINETCDKCFNLDVELLKSQNVHNDLLKSYSQL
nr:hypothetical protein [Tanacetum cinerariifolium]